MGIAAAEGAGGAAGRARGVSVPVAAKNIPSRPVKTREASAEEQALWREAMEGRFISARASPRISARSPLGNEGKRKAAAKQGPVPALGDYAGVDRRTAERFRKGVKAFDGKLDLHGMTRAKAHDALHAFLQRHQDCGSRVLLVITGKAATPAGTACCNKRFHAGSGNGRSLYSLSTMPRANTAAMAPITLCCAASGDTGDAACAPICGKQPLKCAGV